MSPHRILPLCGLLAAAALNPAVADTVGFIAPAWRGDPGTEYGLWDNPDNFSVAYSATLADPGNLPNPGSTSDAVIRQLNSTGFLTGGGGAGNIYSFSAPLSVRLDDTPAFEALTVVLQVRTRGTELDYESVVLSYNSDSGPQTVPTPLRTELDRTSLDGMGEAVSSSWTWDLSGFNVASYFIEFEAAGSSMSLDSVSLDVLTAVPEPMETAAFGAAALLVFGFVRNQRRARASA